HFLDNNNIFLLSKCVSLGIIDCLNNLVENKKNLIKWPNDILIDNEKAAGILIENVWNGNEIKHSLTGIGLNVLNEEFNEENITSLKKCGLELLPFQAMQELTPHIESWYRELTLGNYEKINERYLQELYGYREKVSFVKNEKTYKGVIENVDNDGKIHFKSVEGAYIEAYFKEIEIKI
ncbi:MAG: biotin--[acetyl-CoA-carboxylase] ligase, partial [Flavobacteriales bacterium]